MSPRSGETRVRPLDGLGHRAVVVCDERQDLVPQVRKRVKPDILEFPSQHVASLHRQIRLSTLQCLDAGEFIHAERAFPVFGSFR